jgi:flavin-dependent thymidylate synthase
VNCELEGHYGGDQSHALAAWTSTHRDLDPERKLRIPTLLSILAQPQDNPSEEHGTPFEKSYLQFIVRVDTVTHYQILKHRIGVSVNGESARYKQLREPTLHVPDDWPEEWQVLLKVHFGQSLLRYEAALQELEPILGRKRAKESARFFLLLANELTLDVSFNFRSFVHFLRLRNHETAQREINQLASTMLSQVRSTGDFTHSLAAFNL